MITLEEIKNKLETTGKYWIAFVGDSLTNAKGVHPNWREIVEDVLNEKLNIQGLRCFNFGYEGATSRSTLKRIDEITTLQPDLVVLMIGINDPYFGVGLEEHRKNILEIKNSLSEDFVFVTDNKPMDTKMVEKYSPYVEADRKLNFENFINLFNISSKFPQDRIFTYKFEDIPEMGAIAGEVDYVHPNILGNAYIAKTILKEMFGLEFDPEKYWQDMLIDEVPAKSK